MTTLQPQNQYRIYSIDILRGLVMIIMALDHTRDMFHAPAFTDDPTNLATTTPFLFFTRFITHYCAPVFIFLAGISAYLQSQRKSKKELSLFLIKRGIWLLFIEMVVITFGWTFNLHFNTIILQVIWAIGWCMILLSGVIWLRLNTIALIGIIIVFGHNLLDYTSAMQGRDAGFVFDALFRGNFSMYPINPDYRILVVYPILPWAGLMFLGYYAGQLFSKSVEIKKRKRILNYTGISLIILFVILRAFNLYGDPADWSAQKNEVYTLLSFINVTKYPPSLLFMCITIGPSLLLLSAIETVNNKFSRIITTYGRVPFFYYILHFYILHTICMFLYLSRGHSFQQGLQDIPNFPFKFMNPGEGYGIGVVYLVWIVVVVILYPLCKWFSNYKANHKQWWLSYF